MTSSGLPQDLSAMGMSEPVTPLYWRRMASLICSSLACSTADSLDYVHGNQYNHSCQAWEVLT